MEPFIGMIMPCPYTFAPRGWAFCMGQTLEIAECQTLYSLIGTTYGGDGRTTMKLPDLRGRVIVGKGQSPGTRDYRLGEQGGAETVRLSDTQMPLHAHTSPGIPANSGDAEAGRVPGPTAVPARVAGSKRGEYTDSYSTTSDTTLMAGENTGDAGGGDIHENRQPSLVINYIIALEGIYPERN